MAEGCRNEAASSHTVASCIVFKNSIVAPGSRIKTLTLLILIAQYFRLVVVNAGEAHVTKASSPSFFVHTVYTNPYDKMKFQQKISSQHCAARLVQKTTHHAACELPGHFPLQLICCVCSVQLVSVSSCPMWST